MTPKRRQLLQFLSTLPVLSAFKSTNTAAEAVFPETLTNANTSGNNNYILRNGWLLKRDDINNLHDSTLSNTPE